MRLCFLDIETTGLDERIHVPWEIAAMVVDEDGFKLSSLWYPRLTDEDLEKADPEALTVGRYKDRIALVTPEHPFLVAEDLSIWTEHAIIVGSNPGFDLRFISKLMRENGREPAWHYSPVDAKCLVAGKLGLTPPWSTRELAEAAGIEVDEAHHTALGDVMLDFEMYKFAMGV